MKLLAIDGNSILNRSFYGVRGLSNSKGIPTNAVYGFYTILSKMLRESEPDFIVCAFDLKAPTFRHKKYDQYKANRHGMPDDLATQLPIAKKMLSLMGAHIVEKEGYEADDILGTLSRLCKEQDVECIIATGDRDSLQLVSPGVMVRLATNKEAVFCDEEYVKETYGVTPKELIEVKGLMGDSSDNIPGVKGIGEKTALSLIKNYHSIDKVFEDIDNLEATNRVKNLLKADEAKEIAALSRTLGEIEQSVPMEEDLNSYKKKETDNEKLLELFKELEFKSLIKQFSPISVENEEQAKESEVLSGVSIDEAKSLLKDEKTLDFYFDEKLYIFLKDERVIAFSENKEEALKEIVQISELPKRTTDLKNLQMTCLNLGTEPLENIVCSCDIFAYLLDVLDKDYSVQALKEKYLPSRKLPDCFPSLCDLLEQKLKESKMESLARDIEIPLSQVLSSMEKIGFSIDEGALSEFGDELKKDIERLTSEIYELAGEEFNIKSTKELSKILFEKLALPTGKKTKTGYSTNAEVLEKLIKHHPIAEKVLEYRSLTKLDSTYVVGFKKVIADDGRVHSIFKQTETRTGRISSTEPNMQNIPVRTERGSQMRRFFVARPGYVLLDADYSQIELRVLAHLCGDGRMIESFRQGVDIHAVTAGEVFGFAPELVPPEMRYRAKAINFGIVYGIGAFSLSQDINVSMAEAKRYIDKYFDTYPGVKMYMEEIVKEAKATGYVKTMFGRLREIPEIKAKNRIMMAFGERIARNTPIQGTAADIIKIAMVRVYNRLKKENLDANLILQVHDELLIEVSKNDAEKAKAVLKEEMEGAAQLSVPLAVDVSDGENWYDAKG